MKYSPSSKLFYDPEITYLNQPDDVIEVTPEQHQEALTAIANSGSVSVVDNVFVITPPDPALVAERALNAAWATHRQDAKKLLDASKDVVLRCYESSIPVPTEWKEYRDALRAISEAQIGDPSATLPIAPPEPTY